LAYWTDKDIWEYIEVKQLPINPIYDFADRNGCMTCTGFIGWEKQLSQVNPALYRRIMHMMGKRVLSDYGGIEFEDT
jgi:3'-phosphoadenosine 5'-phosphosulfate sulfotransferase (PAPS reductase)/FAD synthetase